VTSAHTFAYSKKLVLENDVGFLKVLNVILRSALEPCKIRLKCTRECKTDNCTVHDLSN